MKSQLVASDLDDLIYCEIEIGLSKMSDDTDEQYPQPVAKSQEKVALLSPKDIEEKYGVTNEVAAKLAAYQYDLQLNFQAAVEDMMQQTGRYLDVKQLLGDKKYEDVILKDYVHESRPKKKLDPKRSLYEGVAGTAISLILLAVSVWGVRNPTLNLHFDTVNGWIIASLWGVITLAVAVGIPKRYRTRKALYEVKKHHQA